MLNLKGFKSIPGYSDYVVNVDGVVVSLKTGQVLKASKNGSGYLQVTVNRDNGQRQGLGIHRALALTFIPTDEDKNSLIVNHKDGDKLNNSLDNLEWCTYVENSEHAGKYGLTTKCKPISIRDKNGLIISFPSFVKCARFLGVSKDAVIWRVKTKGKIRFKDGYQYHEGYDVTDWPEPINKTIVVKDLEKNLFYIFDKKQDAAKFLKVCPSTITFRLNESHENIYPDKTQIGYLSDFNKQNGPTIKQFMD